MSTSSYFVLPTRWQRALSVIALGLLAFSLAACKSEATDAAAPQPPTVSVAPVALRQIVQWDEFNGRVEAVESVALRSRVSGYIDKVNYEEGQVVQSGEVLFEIDARSYRAALARAEAELAHASTQVALARSEAARTKKLASLQAASTEELEQRRAAVDQAQANMQSAQAAVDSARLELSFTQVRSPITGRAGRALVTAGNLVNADGQASVLTTVVSLDPVHVHFDGDERTYLRYARMANTGERPDQRSERVPVQVALVGETDYARVGHVDFVDNRVDAATGTIRARATLPNQDGLLTPGLYARVRLPGSGTFEAILIDDKAILTDQSLKYVYVVDEQNIAQRRDIKLGRKTEGLRIVEAGLSTGDRVIVNGIQKVSAGMPVAAQEVDMLPAEGQVQRIAQAHQ